MNQEILTLAEEFDADADLLESVAKQYLEKGMITQYEILWHEGAVYRCCAERLRQEASGK